MKNWFQRLAFKKLASVSFILDGSHKISQPKDILTLCYDLFDFASGKIPVMRYQDIQPDGDDFDKMEGTINWYIKDGISLEDQMQVIQEWVRDQSLMDFAIRVRGPEVSGMSHDPDNPLMVIRLDVLKNGSTDYPTIPEMNIANANADVLFRALGIDSPDLTGCIHINDLKGRLDNFTEWDQQQLIQEPVQEGNVFDAGRSYDQVGRYISRLQDIINFGEQNGFDTICWG